MELSTKEVDHEDTFVDSYIKFGLQVTDAPVEFHQFLALGTLAGYLGNKVYLPYGDDNLYPNLWLCLLARSSAFRKSTALRISKKILRNVTPDTILPNDFSQEAFYKTLSSGIGYGTLYIDEFAKLKGLLDREYNIGLKGFLTELFDGLIGHKRKLTNVEYIMPDNTIINLFTSSTIDWLLETIKESDILGGLLPRFTMVPVYKKAQTYAMPPAVLGAAKDGLYNHLYALNHIKGPMMLSAEAKALYDKWYYEFEPKYCYGRWGAYYTRLATTCLKFSILYAINNTKSQKINDLAMGRAIR